MNALNNAPGKLHLGRVDVKRKMKTVQGKQELQKQINQQLEKKFARKWGYT